jgi:hypothetical protein
VVGECSGSRVSNTRSATTILVYIELLLHGVVGPSVVCSEEVGGDLVNRFGVRVGRGSVEALIACIALPLVGMGVVGVQLGVGGVASSIRHVKTALVQWRQRLLILSRWERSCARGQEGEADGSSSLDPAYAESNDRQRWKRMRKRNRDVVSRVVMPLSVNALSQE